MISILFTVFFTFVVSAQNGPLNSEWFYDLANPYRHANQLMQEGKWQQAYDAYMHLVNAEIGTDYDRHMAQLNMASCDIAFNQGSSYWAAIDHFYPIDERYKYRLMDPPLDEDIVMIGSQDTDARTIALFLPALEILKKRMRLKKIYFSAKKDFQHLLKTAGQYELDVVDENCAPPVACKTVSHLMGIIGHRTIYPEEFKLKKPLFAAQQITLTKVRKRIMPFLKNNKKLAVLFWGKNEQEVAYGGRQFQSSNLPADAFEHLLDEHKDLVVINGNAVKNYDENKSNSALHERYNERVIPLADGDVAFDSIIALGNIISHEKINYIGFGCDNESSNVFMRSLSQAAQQKFAFIISNQEGYDTVMEADGDDEHLLSYCRVYKCPSLEHQAKAIQKAYADMNR